MAQTGYGVGGTRHAAILVFELHWGRGRDLGDYFHWFSRGRIDICFGAFIRKDYRQP